MLTTERLALRPWRDEDAPALYAIARDPEVGPRAGWPPHLDEADSLRVIREVLRGPESYAIVLREGADDGGASAALGAAAAAALDGLPACGAASGMQQVNGALIGAIGLTRGEDSLDAASDENVIAGPDECELGYWIARSRWGHGYMTEAARELVRHAFDDLGLRAVRAAYYDGNERSRRVMERCGLSWVETRHRVAVPLLGEHRDLHVMRLTRDAWEHSRA